MGEEGQCPEGYACTATLARLKNNLLPIEDHSSPYGVKLCDPKQCEKNEPCKSECGPGDTECVTGLIPEGGICAGPYRSCEPV